jgi:hypothetical protein
MKKRGGRRRCAMLKRYVRIVIDEISSQKMLKNTKARQKRAQSPNKAAY